LLVENTVLVEATADVVVRLVFDDDFQIIVLLQRLHWLMARQQDAVLRADARRDMRRVVNDILR
jgi:hypothetical protein